MKVLFIVQGEGRGHLTQAITLEEILRRNGHEVVEVLVGKSNTRRLPGFFNRSIQAPVKRFLSPNFLPTPANKRVSMSRSIAYNLMQVPAYLRSICYIHRRIHETDADLVINFYELLTGLTYLFFRPSVPQISVGHQYLFLHHDFEFPQKNPVSLLMLRFLRDSRVSELKRSWLSHSVRWKRTKKHIYVWYRLCCGTKCFVVKLLPESMYTVIWLMPDLEKVSPSGMSSTLKCLCTSSGTNRMNRKYAGWMKHCHFISWMTKNSFVICRVAGRMPLRQALNPFVRLCIWVSLC